MQENQVKKIIEPPRPAINADPFTTTTPGACDGKGFRAQCENAKSCVADLKKTLAKFEEEAMVQTDAIQADSLKRKEAAEKRHQPGIDKVRNTLHALEQARDDEVAAIAAKRNTDLENQRAFSLAQHVKVDTLVDEQEKAATKNEKLVEEFKVLMQNCKSVSGLSHDHTMEVLSICAPSADTSSVMNDPEFNGKSLLYLSVDDMATALHMKRIGDCRFLTYAIKNINNGKGIPNNDVHWNVAKVCEWVAKLGIEQEKFKQENITGIALLYLENCDLSTLGVPLQARGDMLREIEILRKEFELGEITNTNTNNNDNGAAATTMSQEEFSTFLKQAFESNNKLQAQLKKQNELVNELNINLAEVDEDFICPLSHTIMEDPVMAEDGYIYERSFIEESLRHNIVPPTTREPMDRALFPSRKLQKKIQSFLVTKKGKKK